MTTSKAANPGPDSDDPPSYQEQRDDPDEVQQPGVFIMDGLFIHHESVNSAPLYQPSRVIHAQGEATHTIDLERLDNRVRTLADGSPSVSMHKKHIYTLQHFPPLYPVDLQCSMVSASNRGLGKVTLKRSPFPHSGYRASRTPPDRPDKYRSAANEIFFVVKEKRGVFEWFDADEAVVATQDDGEGRHMLLVSVPLSRKNLDGLLALWCLWLWHVHISILRQSTGWSDFKRIMSRPTSVNNYTGFAGKGPLM
ncbi:hypothetical protein B0H66DRAFT_570837 [Apodospora peruviana]|uniref:Uncharacterized protein n=1 Tax=Apodospora peruviana TaxID=516989 RepID=A0AAE0HTY6_9PEZI|nr:hypothetical protein B0H66DRAFT_570837 [Apodospora peruviana]